jgi:hypothetical protein
LRVIIEAAKVELGIGRNIFQLDYTRFQCLLTDTWIKDVWKFCHKQEITINDHVTQNIPLEQENDLYLMEVFSQHSFSNAELQHINQVRLHLQVTTLSDIMCGYGTSFSQAYRIQHQHDRPIRCKWPRQPKPGQKATSLWRQALRECFPRETEDTYTLGKWLHNGHAAEWKWYYSKLTQHLYERKHGKWKVWKQATQRGSLGTTPIFQYYNEAIRLPKQSMRATITTISMQRLRLTGWACHIDRPLESHQPYYYDCNTISDSSALTADNMQLLGNYIRRGEIILVSDGSFNPELQLGTASWVLESVNKKLQITGSLIMPGESEYQCSHCSELSGLLGGIQYVNEICAKLKITQGKSKMGCDGEGAIVMVSQLHDKINSSRSHFDILGAIHSALWHSPISWTFSHVKGHQDSYLDYTDLTRIEQLNVYADELAKKKLSQFAMTVNWHYKRPINIPYEYCSIDWTNQFGTRIRLSSHLQNSLQMKLQGIQARKYWKKKKSITNYHE